MALTGGLQDTFRARGLLPLVDEAAINRNLADLSFLVDAQVHEVARLVEEGTRPLHPVARAAFALGIRLLLGVAIRTKWTAAARLPGGSWSSASTFPDGG